MRGLNRTEIMGYLGADPEMKYTPTGRAVTNFRVAVNRRWRNTEGQPQEKTEWFRVVAWGSLAEVSNQYLQKGTPVYVAGRLDTHSYEASDGQTRYVTDLVARELILLPRSNGHAAANEGAEAEEEELEEMAELPL
jgi:single-strand DNA-binding protein